MENMFGWSSLKADATRRWLWDNASWFDQQTDPLVMPAI